MNTEHYGGYLLTEQDILINSSIETIYNFISNMENFKRWFPEVLDIVSVNEMPHGFIGKVYHEIINLPPYGEQKLRIEVKNIEAPFLYVTESSFEPLLPRMTIKLAQVGRESVKVDWKMESRNTTQEFHETKFPIFKEIIADRAIIGLQNLKKILESD